VLLLKTSILEIISHIFNTSKSTIHRWIRSFSSYLSIRKFKYNSNKFDNIINFIKKNLFCAVIRITKILLRKCKQKISISTLQCHLRRLGYSNKKNNFTKT